MAESSSRQTPKLSLQTSDGKIFKVSYEAAVLLSQRLREEFPAPNEEYVTIANDVSSRGMEPVAAFLNIPDDQNPPNPREMFGSLSLRSLNYALVAAQKLRMPVIMDHLLQQIALLLDDDEMKAGAKKEEVKTED